MLYVLIGFSIGGLVLFIFHKMTSTPSIISQDKELNPSTTIVTNEPETRGQDKEGEVNEEEYRRALEIIKNACNNDNRLTRKLKTFTQHPVTKDCYSTGSDNAVSETSRCPPFIAYYGSIGSDCYASPLSLNSDRNTTISINSSSSEQNDASLGDNDDVTEMVDLETENDIAIMNHPVGERRGGTDVNKATERREEFERDYKIIQNKEDLGKYIDTELESKSKVIVSKSILDEYFNEKLESAKMKIKDEYMQLEKGQTENISRCDEVNFKFTYNNYILIMKIFNYLALIVIKLLKLTYDAIPELPLNRGIMYTIEQELSAIRELMRDECKLDAELRNWLTF